MLDLTFLRKFTKGDTAKMKKYINMFIAFAEPAAVDMIRFFEEKKFDSLRITAHSLKPQISYMGIKELEATIKEIEFSAAQLEDSEALKQKLHFFKEKSYFAIEKLKNELNYL